MSLGGNIQILREKKSLTQEQLAAQIGVTRQTIGQYEKDAIQPTKAKLTMLAAVLKTTVARLYADDVSENLTLVKEPDLEEEKKERLIPLYDVIAVGGTKVLADQAPVSEPSEWIYPGTLFKDADAVITVYGDSMWRDYPHMCKVVCREVKNRRLILWGQVYAIETTEYRVIKRVRRGEDKESIRAESTNTVKDAAGKEIHEHLDIALSDIRRMFLVIGKVDRVQA